MQSKRGFSLFYGILLYKIKYVSGIGMFNKDKC